MKSAQNSGQLTKEMILNNAHDLFNRNGFHVTAMREIAIETGISKAALYYHFKNKKDLMLGILNMVFEQLRQNLFSIAFDESLGSPETRLKKFFEWQELSYNSGPRSCFIGTMSLEIAAHDHDYAVVLNKIFNEWEASLTHLYSHFHSPKSASTIAQQTIAEFEGAVVLGLVRENHTDVVKNAIANAMQRIHK